MLELLTVIGVIGLLTAIVIGVGRYAWESGRTSRARAELAVLAGALESYRATYGDYPRTDVPARLLQSLLGRRSPAYLPLSGPALLDVARFSVTVGQDPFTSETAELLDPWDHPYRYAYKTQAPWTNPGYVLYSAGPDGAATPALLAGGFPDVAAAGNADNLYATR